MNNDKKTTWLGVLIGGIVAANADYTKVLEGNAAEISKLGVAVAVALIGYYTNKK